MGERVFRDPRSELRDGVALVTLDRPEKLNAFTGPMGSRLAVRSREGPSWTVVRLPPWGDPDPDG